MRVPTANVIIGFNRKAMDKLFTAGATYTNLIKELSKPGSGFDNTLLFDSVANPNFISFEHSNNMGDGLIMKLTLIDPKGEFEKRFTSDNIVTTLAGFSYNGGDNPDFLEELVKKGMEKSGSLYTEEFFTDLAVEYAKHKSKNQIFVAYGSGENLDLWAGPHRVVLTAADLSMKGSRKITLTLTPSPTALQMHQRRGSYNEKVNLDLAGLTMRYSGISQNINFKNILNGKSVYDSWDYLQAHPNTTDARAKSTSHILSTFEKAGYSKIAESVKKIDFHAIVVDTLRSYIQKATSNPNVIVLLPNINIICSNLIEEALDRGGLGGEPTRGYDPKVRDLDFGAYWEGLRTGPQQDSIDAWVKAPTAGLESEELVISYFLEQLNLSFLSLHKDSIISGRDPAAIPIGDLAIKESIEKAQSQMERAVSRYMDNLFWAVLEKADNEGIPNHMEAINSVINKILLNSQEEYRIEFGIFNETNTSVLDYWSGDLLKSYPTFGGYKTFNTQREAIIVGDQALIRDYLYGRVSVSEAQKTVAEHQKKAVLAKKNQVIAESETPYAPTPSEAPKLLDFVGGAAVVPEFGAADFGGMGTVPPVTLDFSENLKASKVAALAAEQDYKNNLIKSITVIPIHPNDSILLNEDYQNDIRKLVSPIIKQGSAGFGDISNAPDNFAFDAAINDKKNLSQDLEIMARNEGVSIFKYNTANPNILDMKFHYAGIYLAQLKFGFIKTVEARAAKVAMGILPIGVGTLPIRTVGAAVAFLHNKRFSMNLSDKVREEILQELANRISPELAKKIGSSSGDSYEGASLVAMELKEREKNNDLGGVIEISQFKNGDPQTIMTNFMEEMYRKALQMTITTLPSFHLSNIWDINSPCLVYAQDAPISQTHTPERTLMNSFFSGQYRILGFSHKITTSKSESTFKLAKNVLSYGDNTDE